MNEEGKQQIAVVTGGAGFVGSHLIEALVKKGTHRVISLDNYFTGSKENHIAGAEYREGHTKDIAKHISEKPDLIFHLGEYSRVAKSLEEPHVVWDLNMDGTFGVMEFWRRSGAKLVYAGSSTKFASGRAADGVEGSDLSPYTWAKAANSDLVHGYGRWYDLPYAITYFYNVYGPRERAGVGGYGTLIETFKQNYLAGKSHEVRAPGTQTRAFTHVDDTVSGIMLAAEKGDKDEYGICAKEVFSLLDVAAMFGGEVVMLPATASTRSTGAADTSKLEALGWKQENALPAYVESIKRSKE